MFILTAYFKSIRNKKKYRLENCDPHWPSKVDDTLTPPQPTVQVPAHVAHRRFGLDNTVTLSVFFFFLPQVLVFLFFSTPTATLETGNAPELNTRHIVQCAWSTAAVGLARFLAIPGRLLNFHTAAPIFGARIVHSARASACLCAVCAGWIRLVGGELPPTA